MRRQAGFTLIELISVVVLLGVLAGLGGMFFVSGTKGALQARVNEEAGMAAEMALERISLELRDALGAGGAATAIQVDSTGPDVSIVYTSSALAGQRTLAYTSASGEISITPAAGGTARTLIAGIGSCAMSFSGSGAGSLLTVSFAQQSTSQTFTVTIKPRGNTITPAAL